ncbi:nicotinate (nicotinamide) nucleotide adenylyltransferase [Marinilabiliaceae bacterium ANBcel2]|nr:nicotinate (nicotinamide) nucleotide adenylyltransferase [Marinilabiliaceae bacterium ANBcel2]
MCSNQKKKIETGLLFGSFNPIHIGHLALANYIKEFGDFFEIFFIVTPQNPFKNSTDLADENHRLNMVQIALNNQEGYFASDIEFTMPRPSYTCDTLKFLSQKMPEREFTLITGTDNLLEIERWKNSKEITNNYKIMVYPRPGYKTTQKPPYPNISYITAPVFEISSTLIRNSIKEKKRIPWLLPTGVYDYIDNHNLYRE